MKKIFLLILIAFSFLTACKKEATAPENPQEVKEKKAEKPKKENKSIDVNKLQYVQELESQKDLLNDKDKYWTARTIITDSAEKILDVDVSLDGKWVLYVTKGQENSFVYVLDTQFAKMPRMIYKDTRNIYWARFNETSEKILFSTSDSKGNYYLSSIIVNAPIFQLPEKIDSSIDASIDTCSISPQKILAISSGDQVIADENGFSRFKKESTIELKKENIIFRTFKKARLPEWSRNGKSLIFVSEIFGQPEIVKWDTDSAGIQRITTSKGGNSNPRFSPDSSWVIYNSNESGKNNIYIMSLVDQTKKRITSMKDMEFFKPVWGNDGKIYAIGLKQKLSYLFQFKMEAKMFQVQINGEPGPGLNKMLSPIENAENELGKE